MRVLEHEGAWWAQLVRGTVDLDRTIGPFDDENAACAAADAAWEAYCGECAGYGYTREGVHAAFGFIQCNTCRAWQRRPKEDYPNDGRIQEAFVAAARASRRLNP